MHVPLTQAGGRWRWCQNTNLTMGRSSPARNFVTTNMLPTIGINSYKLTSLMSPSLINLWSLTLATLTILEIPEYLCSNASMKISFHILNSCIVFYINMITFSLPQGANCIIPMFSLNWFTYPITSIQVFGGSRIPYLQYRLSTLYTL